MNVMPLSTQPALHQPSKIAEVKPAISATAETVDFAQLLSSFSLSQAEEQTAASGQQEELIKKQEDLLASLEELPQEALTPEQQEIIQEVLQLLMQQPQSLEEKTQESNLLSQEVLAPSTIEQNNVVEEMVQKEPVLNTSTSEKLVKDTPEQEKLPALLEKAADVLQKGTDDQSEKSRITELPADIKKLEKIIGQMNSLSEELEGEQQKNETKSAAVQVQHLEQVLKQVTGLTHEPINMVQPKEVQPPAATQAVQSFAEIQDYAKENAMKVQEAPAPIANAEESQLPASPEAAKVSSTPQRIETSAPQATVRMSNLVEELGEVLRGSFRLNGEGDSKQIRISIFPEHLGHMDIRLTLIDGKMVAQLFTSSLAAKEALEQQANLLRSSLVQQGINVEKIEIAQQSSQHSFGQQSTHADQRFAQQQKHGSSARNQNGYQRIEEDSAAIARRQTNDGLTMKVDYTI